MAVRTRVAQNEAALKTFLTTTGHPCRTLPRPAGWMAILALPPGVAEEAFLFNALNEGVWAHPGYFYGMPATLPSVILSLLLDPQVFAQGLAGLDRALKRS